MAAEVASMSTEIAEQFEALIKSAWLKEVRGTYSQSDYLIFSGGFRRGYSAARKYEGCQHDWDGSVCRGCGTRKEGQ